jgi:hypothetical protein
MIKIFDDTERDFLGPAENNESAYNFYNRSSRKDVSIIRDTLEKWFSRIPNEEKKNMKSSFVKKFDDTFYELFLHELFISNGFDVTIHPKLDHTLKRPDFLIRKGELEIYVEAKISKDKTVKEEAQERMRNAFYDSINKTKSSNFMLAIEKFEFLSGKQPKTNKIVKYLEEELMKLNPDDVEQQIFKNGLRYLTIEYKDEDVLCLINPVPLSPSSRNKTSRRAIGMMPIETWWGGGEDTIRESIAIKAKRYGDLKKPFIVCINALGRKTSSRIDVDNSVWGSTTVSFDNGPDDLDAKWFFNNDGVFNNKGKHRPNLSAVLITRIFPHSVPISHYWLYSNPFAENPINYKTLGLKYNHVSEGKVISQDGDDLDVILGINKNWLE